MSNQKELKEQLIKEKETLRAYLLSKFDSEDYHAVQDAASDIREIDAMITILNKYNQDFKEEIL